MEKLDIPILFVSGETIPQVWEKSVIKTWEKGVQIKTEYDKEDDPPSRDCTMIMVVNSPDKEPRIHRAFPASLEDLEIYRLEVIEGIHDSWIKPEEGKWTYTYHERLFNYEIEGERIDQVNYIIEKLSKVPYSRRAQGITWNVKKDPPTDDPPCLQRVWFRLTEDKEKNLFLNMNTHWRSRDAFKAAFMNIFAFTDLQRIIAEKISEKINKKILIGRYVDITDSYHIYGSYYKDFEKFLETVKKRTFEERTWHTSFAETFFEEAKNKIKCLKKL